MPDRYDKAEIINNEFVWISESNKVKKKDISRFINSVKKLNVIIDDIRKYIPDATYFIAGEFTTNICIDDLNNLGMVSMELDNADCGGR